MPEPTSGELLVRDTCRVCDFGVLTPVLSFGEMNVSDFVTREEADRARAYPLELVLCNEEEGGCGLLQLKHTVAQETLYRNYWYRSGTNQTMTKELEGIARTAERMVSLAHGDFVLDIAANDGTLLRGYKTPGIHRVGYEPARNLASYNSVGTKKIINEFFGYPAWERELGSQKAKIVTAIAMFYDLEDPNQFVADVAKLLHEEGLFIIQMSYLPLMLSQNAFDNIVHEHLEYYSLRSLEHLLARHHLEACDVELNDVNGGSFRIYIRHHGKGKVMKIREGAHERLQNLRDEEKKLGLNARGVYDEFAARVHAAKEKLKSFIQSVVANGKKVYVYGASTKGNTLLQFFGLDHTLITAAAERNADKWGKHTIGTMIPIISEEQARAEKPDYFLILPWHFLEEFTEREAEFLNAGGAFLVPLPEFKEIRRS